MTDLKELTNLLGKLGIKYEVIDSELHKTLMIVDSWFEEVEFYFDNETEKIRL